MTHLCLCNRSREQQSRSEEGRPPQTLLTPPLALALHFWRFAAAADSNAFRALLETLQRCLCWQEKVVGDGRGGSPDVRLEAVRALGSVVVSCERPSDQAALSACLPHLLQAIQGGLGFIGKRDGRRGREING